MRKYFLILLLLVSAAGFSQTTPNIIYGKEVVIQTRDTSSAELTIKNSTRNVLGYFKNIGGGKGQYVLIPQSDITALPDSLLARYTKAQADARFKSISYVPAWLEITDKPANYSTTHALSNDIQDSLLNKVSRNGSYANPSWITSLDYSKLTGTVPTWNQNTTGNAATVTNGVYTTGSYANPSWITEIAWSKVSGAPSFITGITGSMVTTALGYTPENLANKGIANGYADLDATGKIPASRIDFGQTGQTFVVASQAAMLAVSGANVGALAVRTDENKNYRLIAQPASTLGNWQVLLSPDAPVQSVNGFTGNVNLLTTHISEGSNYWWTAARSRAAQSLTTSGSSGAATYDNTTGVLNIPTYTLSGLGGQPALSGTGFVKISGTTISYDNSTYLTTETDPTIYSWAKAATKPTYSYGEITGTVPTWNQNTTGSAATLSAVLASNLGGAGSVSGLLKANGSGVVSAAVAGTDYVAPSALSGYLPLSAGSGQSLTGSLYLNGNGTNPRYVILNENASYAGSFVLQAGGGSAGFGGGIVMYGHSHATKAGWITAGISASSSGKFSVNGHGSGTGLDVFTVGHDGIVTATNTLNGTSLSMSGGGSFGANTTINTASGGALILRYTGNTNYGEIATNSANELIFKPNISEAGRFASDGTFLINTTTTDGTNKLIVNGGVKASGNITSDLSSGAGSGKLLLNSGGTRFGALGTSNWAIGLGGTDFAMLAESGNGIRLITNGSTQAVTIATSGATTFALTVTSTGFIKSGSSDSYLLTGGGGHVLASNYATTSDLSLYVNMTGNQYEIAGEKTFLSNIATNGKMTAARILGSTASYTTTATISSTITTAFCSGNSYTLTLPSASGVTGQILTVISNSNLTGITLSGVEGGSYTLICNSSLVLVSNGTTWKIASSYQNSAACS